MGEDPQDLGYNTDEQFMPYIDACNISCGAHSGSKELIENTINLAVKHGKLLGAHPSYPDRKNFGRVRMSISTEELLASVDEQLTYFHSAAAKYQAKVTYIKAHGALYHTLTSDVKFAEVYCTYIASQWPHVKLMGIQGGALERQCAISDIEFMAEVFSDRAYITAKKLAARNMDNAVLHDKDDILSQLAHLTQGNIPLIDGSIIPGKADTICIHSDTPDAISRSRT